MTQIRQNKYLTPDAPPDDLLCRSFSIPNEARWLGTFIGALLDLQAPESWEKYGDLTPEETAEIYAAIIANALPGNLGECGECVACTLPGGGKIIRVNSTGHLEELSEDGEWVEPTGDYVIPPPAAREEGTEQDQLCLAAKNATNVLQQLYESLSESWGENLDEAEALTAFIAALITIVGFEFAPISFAIAAFFLAVFRLLYAALAYLGADLWDEAFSDQMVCFLLDCATNTAGVVTFDWECFNNHLNSLADSFGLSEVQLRLYLQVGFMLYFIGGVDGLNLAGGTTEITNDDCNFCFEDCEFFLSADGLKTLEPVFDTTYDSGNGWLLSDTLPAGAHYASFVQDLAPGIWQLGITATVADQSADGNLQFYAMNGTDFGDLVFLTDFLGIGDGEQEFTPIVEIPAGYTRLYVTWQANGSSASVTLKAFSICPG